MTKHQIKSSELHRNYIAKLLDDIVFKEIAASIMKVPDVMPEFKPGVHFDSTCAHALSKLVGVNSFMKELKDLSLPPTKQEIDEFNREMFTDRANDEFQEYKPTTNQK